MGLSLGPAAYKPISRKEYKTMFARVDVDGSGSLSKEDYNSFMVVLLGNALLTVAFQYAFFQQVLSVYLYHFMVVGGCIVGHICWLYTNST